MARMIPNPGSKKTEQVVRNLEALGDSMRKAAASALFQIGTNTINEAIPITPLRPRRGGSLRRSAFVDLPKPKGSGVEVKVGFDGRSAPYALWVHEMPDSTNWSEPGTGNKFLEKPFNRVAGRLPSVMAAAIERRLRRNDPDKA